MSDLIRVETSSTALQGHPMASQADDDLHLIQLWLHGKSPNSQEAYRRDVNQFVDPKTLKVKQ